MRCSSNSRCRSKPLAVANAAATAAVAALGSSYENEDGDSDDVHMSYGPNLGWGGPIGDYIGFWGGLLRDMLQIQ